MNKALKDMALWELKEEARPILERERRQEKENRDNFFKALAGMKHMNDTDSLLKGHIGRK